MKTSRSSSRSTKRIRLEEDSPNPNQDSDQLGKHDYTNLEEVTEDSEDCCTICLQPTVDRTVIPNCSHEFCFGCLLVWSEQSRRCPLCSQSMGDYLIHSIRSRYDYRKHYLAPMRTSPSPHPTQNHVSRRNTRRVRRRPQGHVWGMRDRDADEELDKLERSISKRRWVYEHDLYAKHVASNSFTKYRPYPTPAQFSASQDLVSRTTSFLRRELQVWENLDVEFLTTLIISLMKSIDIRSESAVKLMSEFLDMDVPHSSRRNAEHFVHEVYSYVRSPYKDLFVYDSVVQYDSPPGVPSPPNEPHERRWHHNDTRPSLPYPDSESSTGASRSHKMDTDWLSRRVIPSRSPPPTRMMKSLSPSPESPEVKEEGKSDRNPDEGRSLDSTESGLPRPECSTLRPERSVSAKGKERADFPASSQLNPSASRGSCSNLQMNSFSDTPLNPPTSEQLNTENTAKMRLPRNKSLLESINAHLGLRNIEPHDVELASTGSRTSSTGNGPALSSRDPIPRGRPVNGVSKLPLVPELSPPEKQGSLLDPSNKNEKYQDKEELVDGNTTLDIVEARARLLARLSREKRRAEFCTSLSGSSRNKPLDQGASPRSGTPDPVDIDLEEREGKLRVEALLRAKVARKRHIAEST